MAENVNINIKIAEQAALNALKKLQNETVKTESSFKSLGGAAQVFAGNLAASLATKALAGFSNQIDGVVDAAKKLEVFETQFKTILGSTEAAKKQLEDLQNFAATTPFQIEGLSLATRQLLSFGVAQSDVIPTMRRLGDLAAGTGSAIDELTIPFGRLISSQKLTLVELDKFSDRGINLYRKLADQTGISIKDIRKAVTDGKVPFEEFTKAIEGLTSKGGMFFGATVAQSKTLAGVTSTLKDNFFNLQGEIGKALAPALIKAAEEMTNIFQELAKVFSENGTQIATVVSKIADTLLITPSKFWLDVFEGSLNAQETVNQLKSLDEQISSIEAKISSLEKSPAKGRFENILGGTDISRQSNQLSDLKSQYGELLAERSELIKQNDAAVNKELAKVFTGEAFFPKDKAKPSKTEDDIDAKKLDAERKFQEQLLSIKEEFKVLEEESRLGELDQDALRRELGVEALKDGLDIESQIRVQAIDNEVADEKKKALLIEKEKAASLKRQLKAKKAYKKEQNKLDEQLSKNTIGFSIAAADALIALTGDNALASLALSKAAAAAEILIQDGKARAAATFAATASAGVGGPAAVAAAAAPLHAIITKSTILSLATVAAQTVAQVSRSGGKFADGGVVGGFGASGITDSVSTIQTMGEMNLNGAQQAKLFNMINNGAYQTGGDIVVEIDGREIARATRSAIRDGYKIA